MTKNSLNIDKKAAFKKRIHLKYDYLLEQRGKLPKAKADNSLFEGVNQCVRKHSDLPYFRYFYENCFLKYDIDSLIDLVDLFHGSQKKVYRSLIVSSIFEYMADLPKQDCNNGGLIMELSDVYYDIRMNERLWFGDNDTIKQYLKKHYADRILHATYPQKGSLTYWYNIRNIKQKSKNIEFNVVREKKIFCKLVKSVFEELSKPNSEVDIDEQPRHEEEPYTEKIDNAPASQTSSENIDAAQHNNTLQKAKVSSSQICIGSAFVHDTTNIDALDSVDYESAEEVELYIGSTDNESETKRNKNTVRQKGDVDYVEQQTISQKIGDAGEKIVLQNEIVKLTKLGLPEVLISKVRRVLLESDEYGFDILSFDDNGNERYLEVKTTKVDKPDFSFILTQNEFEHAKELGDQYCIVIVYGILNNPRIWYMGNPFIEEPYKVRIKPTQYRVDVSIR